MRTLCVTGLDWLIGPHRKVTAELGKGIKDPLKGTIFCSRLCTMMDLVLKNPVCVFVLMCVLFKCDYIYVEYDYILYIKSTRHKVEVPCYFVRNNHLCFIHYRMHTELEIFSLTICAKLFCKLGFT